MKEAISHKHTQVFERERKIQMKRDENNKRETVKNDVETLIDWL